MDEAWIRFIAVGVGALCTGAVTLIVQSVHFKRQREWDREKQEAQYKLQKEIMQNQREISKDQFVREQLNQKIAAYNKILNVDNGVYVIYYEEKFERHRFDYEVYKESVRPLLYENLHLLEDGIANSVFKIDSILAKLKRPKPVPQFDVDILCREYENITNSIHDVIYEYRENFSIKN
ncbi:hypothetical protein [Bacillus swezeyi]|uniref:hypothetical protein n=1 Tax=Bacillus swezeyi TaxID=1925020 RepID=UPI00123C6957|nr:hypothetical protein [Bacillus swezeyi]KAA6475802.1 hypothetical protein DX928_06770 [Bacillus swezeyi]